MPGPDLASLQSIGPGATRSPAYLAWMPRAGTEPLKSSRTAFAFQCGMRPALLMQTATQIKDF